LLPFIREGLACGQRAVHVVNSEWLGLPSPFAISPYVLVSPGGIFKRAFQTSF
jgi:predicted LPLAT superfamily acyltransferase